MESNIFFHKPVSETKRLFPTSSHADQISKPILSQLPNYNLSPAFFFLKKKTAFAFPT